MLASLILASSVASLTQAMSAPAEPPAAGQSRNSAFLARHYPPNALARGEQGRVGFEITVDRDGFVSSCVITGSSGFANLDRETCEFLTKYAKPKPVQDAEGRFVQVAQQGYVDWKLPAGARRAASVKVASLAPDQLICRKYPKAGSKVGFVRQCMTQSEWTLHEDLVREDLRRMQENRTCGRLVC